ncbi:MAG: MBL fold metallo-hydrolase [Angelakisella sp.]
MVLSFLGAAHEVTGSCYCLTACGKKLLIDCGMQQGEDESDNQTLPFVPGEVDYVLLTHSHIDHSGRLPLLYKYGFHGQLICTKATADLCGIMLRDSAHIQEFEAEWKNRKGERAGRDPIEPLYTTADAEGILSMLAPCDYEETVMVTPGITARFVDVGHLLGSASIEITITEEGQRRVIAFSGDIGNLHQPILKDPSYLTKADYVVMESTYGDRNHDKLEVDHVGQLAEIIDRTFARGGNLVIPSFAVGRTQELLYFIRKIKEEGLVKHHPEFAVYVDSPLAVEATQIFKTHVTACFDEEAMALVNRGVNPLSFPGLKTSVTSEDSKAINFDTTCKVIISASGMCDAGRIKHHLKHNLWKNENTILFVGYQSVGTMGRMLLDGAKTVKIFSEIIDVRAEITKMSGMSGHADQAGLIKWIRSFDPAPQKVFVSHGAYEVSESFAQLLREQFSLVAEVPNFRSEFDLLTGACLSTGEPYRAKLQATKKADSIFARLLAAVARLTAVAQRYRERPNKEIAKFSDQLNSLCDKWEE